MIITTIKILHLVRHRGNFDERRRVFASRNKGVGPCLDSIWTPGAICPLLLVALVGAFLTAAVFVLGLLERISIARKHPDGDTINAMSWSGFLAVVPWMQAFLWH